MADSTNIYLFDGNLTKAPVLERIPNGTAVANYTVALNRSVRGQEGKEADTSYIPVTSYGRQAENDARFLRRGSAVFVKCEVRSWRNAETGKSGFKFVALSVRYLGQPTGQPKGESTGAQEDASGGAEDEAWVRDFDEAGSNGR